VYGSEADPATGKWSGANTTEEVFDETIDANFRGAYFIVQNALPHMSDGGAIVFTTFWFDAVGVAGTPAVSASKAELPNLTRQWPPSWSPEVSASTPVRRSRWIRPADSGNKCSRRSYRCECRLVTGTVLGTKTTVFPPASCNERASGSDVCDPVRDQSGFIFVMISRRCRFPSCNRCTHD
jgi:hypothetical protein